MIETAMVMAAGHGTRMRPLTDKRSKAMVKVAGRPLIDHMLDRLEAAGVKKAVVNVHAHADQLERHLKRRTSGPEIIISDERDELLETGGGVVKALPLLGQGPVLICNIDAIWTENGPVIEGLIKAWDHARMDDLLLLAPMNRAMGYNGAGDFELEWDGRLIRRQEEVAPYVYAGVQIADLTPFHSLKPTKFSRNLVWNDSLIARRMFGHVMDGFWMHVGDPQAKKVAEAYLKARG